MRLAICRELEAPAAPTKGTAERFTVTPSDLALSATVGTGCGAFVGTDVSFGAANWLAPAVGIQEKFGAARACVAAGLSTSIGFMANMVVQAAALPAKACWIDPDYANPRAA